MIQLTSKEEKLFSFIRTKANELGVTVRAAGGWIRDKLLDIESHDIDFAIEGMSGAEFAKHCAENVSIISARPEQSKHLETAMVRLMGWDIDFCGLRKETYADSRIPSIDTGTPEEDASRRDLTINSLFFNLSTNEIEDYVGGLDDLNNKVARTPLDAYKTFMDDPLRILRCIRFCAKYGLTPTDDIINAANTLEVQEAFESKISKERIFTEVFGVQEGDGWKQGILTGPNPSAGMQLALLFGFMDILFSPKNVALNHWDTDQNSKYHDLSILHHTLKAVEAFNTANHNMIPKDIGIVNLALICHDLGKRDVNCRQLKDDGTFSYLTHDDRSVELASIVLNQMLCPSDIKSTVLNIVKHHMRFHALNDNCTDKSLRKILRDLSDDWKLLLHHSLADSCGKISVDVSEMVQRHDAFDKRMQVLLTEQGGKPKAQRPINGHELQELGIAKGPVMGEIFRALDEALLDNPGMSKEEAILFINNNFKITK